MRLVTILFQDTGVDMATLLSEFPKGSTATISSGANAQEGVIMSIADVVDPEVPDMSGYSTTEHGHSTSSVGSTGPATEP